MKLAELLSNCHSLETMILVSIETIGVVVYYYLNYDFPHISDITKPRIIAVTGGRGKGDIVQQTWTTIFI